MDIFDQATDREMQEREIAIACVRSIVQVPRLTANGLCHNCAEQVADGVVFCDSDCRDDWQRRELRS